MSTLDGPFEKVSTSTRERFCGRDAGPSTSDIYDVAVLGAGHNGLVAAAYLARAGLSVIVLERRQILGGPVGTYEFLPGYRTAFTNSPGSLDPRVVEELDLKSHGLRFVRPDPTLVHHFPDRPFIAWRDSDKTRPQFDAFAAGDADRYKYLVGRLEDLARKLNISVYEPAPDLDRARERLNHDERKLFDAVFYGSLQGVLDAHLQSDQAKAVLGMVALNTTLARPSDPGTAVGLMMRPIAMASAPPGGEDDPRKMALRGSTGLPVGGMGALIEALESVCVTNSVQIQRQSDVVRVRACGDVHKVEIRDGHVYRARKVVAGLNPQTVCSLLDDDVLPDQMRQDIRELPMTGSGAKVVFALNRIPRYQGLPSDLSNDAAASTQFRIGPSLEYMEHQIDSVTRGLLPEKPLVWGLMPTVTSSGMAPAESHILSANVWHAPYEPANNTWDVLKPILAERTIDAISQLMPDFRECIDDLKVMSPVDLETELGLIRSHITHGDMLTRTLFGSRPHVLANDYRTPLKGFYLTGSGTWPGGYVTGIPGRNASQTVLYDIKSTA